MKPRCRTCDSENLALVSAGLSCLDCGFSESRIQPTGDYQRTCIEEVDFRSVPRMKQRSRLRAGKALAAFAKGMSVDRFWKEMMESRGGPDEMPTQTKMFDKED